MLRPLDEFLLWDLRWNGIRTKQVPEVPGCQSQKRVYEFEINNFILDKKRLFSLSSPKLLRPLGEFLLWDFRYNGVRTKQKQTQYNAIEGDKNKQFDSATISPPEQFCHLTALKTAIATVIATMAASMDEPVFDDEYLGEYFNGKWCCRFQECPCIGNNIYNNSTISLAPEDALYQATEFTQDFWFGVGPNTNITMITFTDEDINTLKTIYESYTAEYSPLSMSSDDDDIITRFYFEDLSLLTNNNNNNNNITSIARGFLVFKLLFESRTVDVSNYHELFGQWTVDHSEKVLEDWQQALEGWNITELDNPVWASTGGTAAAAKFLPPPISSPTEWMETSSVGRVLSIFQLVVGMICVLVAI